MKRNPDTLKNQLFDVLIVGGGIHGAATARECARQGLATALIEKNDFGGATSANSLKIIHGGLRYLQHLNIKRMRESIESRRIASTLAPHLIKPLGCAIPNSGLGLQSNLVMRIGLLVNDCIASDRNNGIEERCKIPQSKVISKARCKELFPAIDWEPMTGGSIWYEAFIRNSERLTLAFIQDAVAKGAEVANYVKVQELLVENNVVSGCRVIDTQKNEAFTINAKTVVMTSGPWNDPLLQSHGTTGEKKTRWAKAINIIVRKSLFQEYAIGLTGEVDYQDQDAVLKKKGRFFFFVPWRGYTMIGTTYKRFDGTPDQLQANRQDVEELLAEVNMIHPAAQLQFADVTNVHAGLVPISSKHGDKSGEVQPEKETTVVEYGNVPATPKGLIAVKSVKFTTAPVVAQETCTRITRFLQQERSVSAGSAPSFPAASGEHTCPPEFTYLKDRYGNGLAVVLRYVMDNKERISNNPPLCLGEIEYFIQEEMALNVADVVFRRSELATAECPPDTVLRKISEYMGKHFGWSKQRVDTEIQEIKGHFSWN